MRSFLIILSGCSERKGKASVLDDALFLSPPITETTEVSFNPDVLVPIDGLKKRQWLPDITQRMQMDKEFPYCSLFSVFFVSKQVKVGSIQPIIIRAVADGRSRRVHVLM